MTDVQLRDSDRRLVEKLLLEVDQGHGAGSRIAALSRHFLGSPYKANPLIGSAETAEVFTASLDGFDCVTYVETVLALARAATVDEFTQWLGRIRYEQGRIQWERRNHYMTQWIRNNEREGIVRQVLFLGVPKISRDRVLNAVPGLAPQRTHLECVPKAAAARLDAHLQSGDLMFFVSTRSNLDMFHCGIVVRDGKRVLMRHASRSAGSVVEQELSEFIRANRMTGLIVARPQG
jgi:cell wall-associated NlpC family hydrolase